jgi:hypothetical protein
MSISDTSDKTNGSVPPIDPVTVGNPTRASAFAVDQNHLDEIFADGGGQSSVVLCQRPPKGHFFTCRPEKPGTVWQNRRLLYFLLIDGHDPYVVAPALAKAKLETEEEDCIRPVLIVRYVTMQGVEALWALKLDRGEKINAWNVSARNILQLAERGWVRILSLKGHYQHQPSRKTLTDVPPKFTERTIDELIDIAFAERMVDESHEVWEWLRDGSTK